jgi:hypothetical protein
VGVTFGRFRASGLRNSRLFKNEELCGRVEGVDPRYLSFMPILNIKCNIRASLNLGEIFERYNIIYYIIQRFIKMDRRE